jgi:hypothetical protein
MLLASAVLWLAHRLVKVQEQLRQEQMKEAWQEAQQLWLAQEVLSEPDDVWSVFQEPEK